jgi:hypothetical protein
MSKAPKPEWDTPPRGDFAAYVERLSGAVPGAQTLGGRAQASVLGSLSGGGKGSAPAAKTGHVVPTKAVAPGAPAVLGAVTQVLRVVRGVLLLSVAVQALALFVLGQGSWWGLFATAFLWWGLGRAASLARTVLTLPGTTNAEQGIAQLKQQLAALAQQKNTGKRK